MAVPQNGTDTQTHTHTHTQTIFCRGFFWGDYIEVLRFAQHFKNNKAAYAGHAGVGPDSPVSLYVYVCVCFSCHLIG